MRARNKTPMTLAGRITPEFTLLLQPETTELSKSFRFSSGGETVEIEKSVADKIFSKAASLMFNQIVGMN